MMNSSINLHEIHLEGSTACDAKCIFCTHKAIQRRGVMDIGLFRKIVDEAVELGCEHFTPFGTNEPLIIPHLFDWLDYFREKQRRIFVFTNANNLTDAIGDRLLEYEGTIVSITISFHGGTPAVYEQVMGLNFEKVRQNIVRFMAKSPAIPVNIYSLKLSATDDSLPQFMSLWDGMGFAGIGLQLAHTWAGEFSDELDITHATGLKKYPCSRVVGQMDVLYDGRVPLCCLDAHCKVLCGDLSSQSIAEVWNSDIRRHYREMHNAGRWDDLPLCDSCYMNLQ